MHYAISLAERKEQGADGQLVSIRERSCTGVIAFQAVGLLIKPRRTRSSCCPEGNLNLNAIASHGHFDDLSVSRFERLVIPRTGPPARKPCRAPTKESTELGSDVRAICSTG